MPGDENEGSGKPRKTPSNPSTVAHPDPSKDPRRRTSSAHWRVVMGRALDTLKSRREGSDPEVATFSPPPGRAVPQPSPGKPEDAGTKEGSTRTRTHERRQSTRVPCQETIQWTSGRLRGSGRMVNISEGGLCMNTNDPLKVFTRIKLFLQLLVPDLSKKELLLLEGVVVRRNGEEVGVSFVSLTPETTRRLRRFIQSSR